MPSFTAITNINGAKRTMSVFNKAERHSTRIPKERLSSCVCEDARHDLASKNSKIESLRGSVESDFLGHSDRIV